MKRYLLILWLACAFAGSLYAQNTTTFGNIVSQGVPCGSSNCVYYQLPPGTPWVSVAVTGTWVGTLEAASTSAPNANYSNLNTLVWTALSTQTANGTWTVATSGATYLRVRATAWTSGLARVGMDSTLQAAPLVNPVFPGQITGSGVMSPTGGSSSNCWSTDGGVVVGCGGSTPPASAPLLGTDGGSVLQSITLGSNLSLSGNTLNASGGAAPSGNALQTTYYSAANTLTAVDAFASASPQIAAAGSATNARAGFQIARTGNSGQNSFGDSITLGTGAGSCSAGGTCYVQKIFSAIGSPGTLNNYGVGGWSNCDVNRFQVFSNDSPTLNDGILRTLMASTNDLSQTQNYLPLFSQCQMAMESWLAVPSSLKYFGSSFGTPPTNWTLDATLVASGIQTSTASATSTWPVTTTVVGQSEFVWFRMFQGNANSAIFKVTCDDCAGYTYDVPAYTNTTINTGTAGTTDVVGVFLLPNTSRTVSGSHTVTISTPSTLAGTDVISILAVGISPVGASGTNVAFPTTSGQMVLVGGTPYQYADVNGGRDNPFNENIRNGIRTLQNAFLNVNWINVRNQWRSDPSTMFDSLNHPNDAGHQLIANAFLGIIGQPLQVNNPDVGHVYNVTTLSTSTQCNTTIPLGYNVADSDQLINLSGSGTCILYFPTQGTSALGTPAGTGLINYQKIFWVKNAGTVTATVQFPASATSGVGGPYFVNPKQLCQFIHTVQNLWDSTCSSSTDVTQGIEKDNSSSTYTLLNTDNSVYNTAASATLTLPTANNPGKFYFVHNAAATAATLSGGGTQTPATLPPTSSVCLFERNAGNYATCGSFGFGKVAAGFTTIAAGQFGFDSTNNNWKFWDGTQDTIFSGFASASPPTTGDFAVFTKTTNRWNLTDSGVKPLSLPTGTATFSAGSGVTSVVCASGFSCNNTRGTLTIVGGTATTGTIATVTFSAALSAAPQAFVGQNGGTSLFDIGNSAPTTTAFNITSGVTVLGATFNVNYQVQP